MERGEARSLALGYSTDGGEPYSHLNIPCSIWPECLRIFNLGPEVRDQIESVIMVGIIPGRKAPKNMNPFHEVMVNDVLKLMEGVQVWDASRREHFILKADILSYVFDWPARSKCTSHQGHRAIAACPYCQLRAHYWKDYKVTTFGESRRFLPMDDSMRDDSEKFPEKSEERRGPPHPQRHMNVYGKEVTKLVSEIRTRRREGNTKGIRPLIKTKNVIMEVTGKTGLEKLADIPTYSIDRVHVDYFHTGKNIAHSMSEVVKGSKDNFTSIVNLETSLGRFGSRSSSETQVYQLSKEQIAEADRRLLTVKVPIGYDFKIRAVISKPIGMKSIEWIKLFSEGLYVFALRGMLPPPQEDTLSMLCHTLQALGSPVVDMEKVPELRLQVHKTFSRLERDFPIGFRTLMWHLPHHMVTAIEKYGPNTGLWIAGFERYMKVVLSRMTSQRNPTKACLEAHRISFLCKLLVRAGRMPALCGGSPRLEEEHEEGDEGEGGDADGLEVESSVTTLVHLKGTLPHPVAVQLDQQQQGYFMTYVANAREAYSKPTFTMKYFAATSRHPLTQRIQDYRCEEIEVKRKAKSISSVVGLVEKDGVYFGRIQYFLLVDKHEVPYIKWYGRGERDAGTKLWTVQLSGAQVCWMVNPFQPFSKITKPLVHATEHNTLYILDCHDADLCEM